MKVSVVLCTYAESMYDDFTEAADSVLSQTYDDVELVIVVDGTETVCEKVQDDYGRQNDVRLHCNDENIGLSESRNVGVEVASGDVVGFLDDDAVADEEWVEELVSSYQEQDAIAVGGKMTPRWVSGKPTFLPAEFYWLVGVTHRGFADGPGEVRNTFGSNISFRQDVLETLGGFDSEIGRQGDKNLQSEETLLCLDMRKEFGEGVWYNPDAIVSHKVFEYRTDFFWLLDRAFWQGYSKRAMETVTKAEADEESDFLRQLLTEFVPRRLKSLVKGPSIEKASQLATLLLFTGTVGLGYLYGFTEY